ncbi:MAG: hypothetical protein M0026_04230 [Nocardiopsaceae bacterium]|nr:hypothetical protein [Nocardiopsaceae bacterium]
MSSQVSTGGCQATSGTTRRSLLTNLAAELRKLGVPALIALSGSDHPVLYALRTSGGHRVAVLAVEHGGEWWFMWGKNDQVAADRPDLAARFLSGADAQVLDLMARRPQPREAGARLSAVA